MSTMIEIESKTKQYAKARESLTDLVAKINEELQAVYGRHRRELHKVVAQVTEHKAELTALLEASPELFEKPKTQTFSGVKVGFRKGAGGLSWEDEDSVVVERIEKMFGNDAEGFLIITKKPAKEILADLPATDLKKLGVTLEDTSDVPLVKAVDGAVEKTVKALLKSADRELEAA